MEEILNQLNILVEKYHSNIKQYRSSSYNETEVRIDFVNPLFEILGWDILNRKDLPQFMREVKHEAEVIVEEYGELRKKRPDYSFRAGVEPCFFLETKKPNVDISINIDSCFQIRRYGWSGNLPISVITNFEYLIIYDCSIRPVQGDDVTVGRVAKYHYSEYLEKFDEIYSYLSRDSVVSGDFYRRFASLSSSITKEPFDDYFLKQIKGWRNSLSSDVYKNNKAVSVDSLNIYVQKVLNRIMFLRIGEDRNYEKYETLKNITTYNQLKSLFALAEKKYDSGLFELIEDGDLQVSDRILISIFKELYYPYNSYEFSVIDPYIIGQIYELFLDEVIVITNEEIDIVKKPEIVDSLGSVSTPKNIADIIVRETLDKIYVGRSPSEIKGYKIADICCGSGNFLISVFEYIINYYIEYYCNNCKEDALKNGILFSENDYNFMLSFEIKRDILVNNIVGVDIDPLAVEVAKFSLMLKLLEETSLEEANEYSLNHKVRILPNLDKNIRVGNSLVDGKFAQYRPDVFDNISLLKKIHMFDWSREFKNVQFDAIVGNPPYIRVQNMVQYSVEEYDYFRNIQSGYTTSKSELFDKYYLFIEKGISLLKTDGVLGYIVPHRFMNISSGEEIRSWLSNSRYVLSIIHFGTHQIFTGRSTYTCILVLRKNEQEKFNIQFVENFDKFICERKLDGKEYLTDYLSSQPWVFNSEKISRILENIKEKVVPLNEITDIFVGVQTSNDKVYIINPVKEDEDYIHFIDKNGNKQIVEKSFVRPSIYDLKINKYQRIKSNAYILFPYKIINGKSTLYDTTEMEELFPFAYKYLKDFKDELSKRNMPNRNESNWFAYGRSQSLKRFQGDEHLIWAVLSTDYNYVYDNDSVTFTGGGNGPYYGLQMKSTTKESIFYLQALLNNWVLESIIKCKGSIFRGGYYSHGKQFIAELPIYRIDFENEKERTIHDNIVESVKNVMTLSSELEKTITKDHANIIHNAIELKLEHINSSISALYKIGIDEIIGD